MEKEQDNKLPFLDINNIHRARIQVTGQYLNFFFYHPYNVTTGFSIK